jgi:hypothetical protein
MEIIEFESQSGSGVQHYVIKFVSDLRQVGGFLRLLRFHPPRQTLSHNVVHLTLIEIRTQNISGDRH